MMPSSPNTWASIDKQERAPAGLPWRSPPTGIDWARERVCEEDRMSQWNKYGPTAARVHGLPGRELRPKSLTIDLHSHVGVPRASEFVRPHLAPTASPLVRFANAETKELNPK